MSSSTRLRSSARVGCIFCGRTGPPSSINDHLRKYVSPPHADKKLKGANYHHHDIIHAFASKSKPNAQFLKTVSQDRLAVLQAFAETITPAIHSDHDADMWQHRDYWLRDYTEWEKSVKLVHKAYMDSQRDKLAMQDMVAQVVAAFVAEDMKAQKDQVESPAEILSDDDDADRHLLSQASLTPTVHSRQSKSANTRMHMHGPSTQRARIRDVYSARTTTSTRNTQPPVVEFSSSSSSSDTPSAPSPDKMQPLLTLKVRAITNELFTIPLEYPISHAAALDKVWRLGPEHLHDLAIPHRFVGDGEDPRWAGAWAEVRWDEVLVLARKCHLVVELRMVIE